MRRATPTRHSSTGWKPGCFFASRSAQAQSSSSERRMSIGRRSGCFTYQGGSNKSAQRLLHVRGCVDEELDAVALGIVEVDRERVAVRGRVHLLHLLLDQPPVHLPQSGKVRHAERDLVYRAERQLTRPAGGEDDLVVVLGIAREQHELQPAARRIEIAGVGDGKTEHACVKIPHSREIGHEHPHVAEREFWYRSWSGHL